MSAINVTSVEVLDNPTHFANPLQFEIQYECLYQLQHGEDTPSPSLSIPACVRSAARLSRGQRHLGRLLRLDDRPAHPPSSRAGPQSISHRSKRNPSQHSSRLLAGSSHPQQAGFGIVPGKWSAAQHGALGSEYAHPSHGADTLSVLSADLEWKLIYVGSAESEDFDQVLDSVLVGPVYPGQYRFVFQVWIARFLLRPCSALVSLATVAEEQGDLHSCKTSWASECKFVVIEKLFCVSCVSSSAMRHQPSCRHPFAYSHNMHGVVQSNPPDPAKLRLDDIMGITVILLTCSYNGKVRRARQMLWQEANMSFPPIRRDCTRMCANSRLT